MIELILSNALFPESTYSSDYKDRETGSVVGSPHEIIQPDKKYITISIKSARIEKVKKLWKKYHGVVYSFFRFLHSETGVAEMASVTLPTKLKELDGHGVNNVIQMDDIVLGPVPYRGGSVEMEIGLLAVEHDDLAGKFVGFIGKVGEQTGAPKFFAKSVPILGLIKSGIEMLTGTNKAKSLKIGIAQELWGETLKTGFYFASHAEKGEIDSSKLTIDKEDGRLLLNGEPFKDDSYFVFSISATQKRDDIESIPELLNGYQEIQAAVRVGDLERAKKAVDVYKFLCLASPDLIDSDRIRLWKEGKHAYDLAVSELKEKVAVSAMRDSKGAIGAEMPDFADIAAYN